MSITEVYSIVQVASAIVTAIWAVFKIKSSNEKLGINIEHLSLAVAELKDTQQQTAKEVAAAKEALSAELSLVRAKTLVNEARILSLESKVNVT